MVEKEISSSRRRRRIEEDSYQKARLTIAELFEHDQQHGTSKLAREP